MAWWEATLWALLGGFVVEGLEFTALIRRHRKWPWQVGAETVTDPDNLAAGPLGYFVGEAVRLAVGGALGAALADQVSGPLPALAVGAVAPVIAGHLVAYVPLPATTPSLPAAADSVLPSTSPPAPASAAAQGPALQPPAATSDPVSTWPMRASSHEHRAEGGAT